MSEVESKARITDEVLDRIAAEMAEMPEKPGSRERTTREAVQRLKPQLAAMRDKGYSLEERAAALQKFGMNIKASTLKGYERGGAKKTPAVKKSKPATAQV